MRYLRYGIEMRGLDESQLEMVRKWRNQPFVRLHMYDRQLIRPASQLSWFSGLDPIRDWYFVAYRGGRPFGLFHIKDIDWEKGCGESGGFVGHRNLIGSMDTGLAILGLMEFAFLVLGLERLVAKYHPKLTQIVHLNRQLGYEVYAEEAAGFLRAGLGAARFFEKTGAFRRAAKRIRGDHTALLEVGDFLRQKLKNSGATPAVRQGEWGWRDAIPIG